MGLGALREIANGNRRLLRYALVEDLYGTEATASYVMCS